MPRFRLHKGMHFELRGREYVVELRLRNGDLQIKDVALNEYQQTTETEILNAWFEGALRFSNDNRDTALAQRKASGTYIQELSFLNDDDPVQKKTKIDFHRRRKYISAVMSAQLERMNKETLQPIIDEVSKTAGETDLPDQYPPSWKTLLYSWLNPFLKCKEDFRLLVPSYKARGNTTPKFVGLKKKRGESLTNKEKQNAEKITEIIIEVKDEKLLSGQRCSIASICDTIRMRINEVNEFRDDGNKLPHPGDSGIYAFFDRNLDEYEKETLRYGKKYADQKFRENKQGPIPSRPLERTEIDHTLVDLMVIDTDVMLPIGRPHFTSQIDVFTKMDLGFYASFNYPGYLAIMQCLKHAILPKTYVKERYPSVRHAWPCYGIPETVVIDNAPEFHSDSLEEASIQLGFIVQYGPKGEAWYRGVVERHFRGINQGLLHKQPGTTFSNVLDKGDYDPHKNALISFDNFMEMAHIFLIDIYPRQRHRGIRVDKFPRRKLKDIQLTPARLWETSVAEYPPSLPPHRDELLVLIGELEHRVISSSGIELDGLFYNCERLAALRREVRKGGKVALKRDLDDLSRIHVRGNNGEYIHVPAVNQEYTSNLTLWQHKKIKEYARRIAKETVDIHDLLRAKQTIQELVERAWKVINKSGTRKRLARFKGIGQEDYTAKSKGDTTNNEASLLGSVNQDPALFPGSVSLNGISDLSHEYLPSNPSEILEEPALISSNIRTGNNSRPANGTSASGKQKKAGSGKLPYVSGKKGLQRKSMNEELESDGDSALEVAGYSATFNLPNSEEYKHGKEN